MHSTSEPTKEPSPVSESLPTSLSSLVNDHPDWENSPKVQINCPRCGNTHWHNQSLASVFKESPCDPCSSAYSTRLGDNPYDDPIQTTQSILDTLLPPSFRDTDPFRIPPLLQPVLKWKPNPKGIGLWITGDTRTFKSRSLSLLIKRLTEENVPVTTFFHGAFNDELLDVIRSSRSLRAWKRKTSSVPVLAIDDLFATKLTEHAESSIFEIIDSRIHSYLPTLVTTQVTSKEAKLIFASHKRHEALFARIKESFTLVNSNPPIQSKLPV